MERFVNNPELVFYTGKPCWVSYTLLAQNLLVWAGIDGKTTLGPFLNEGPLKFLKLLENGTYSSNQRNSVIFNNLIFINMMVRWFRRASSQISGSNAFRYFLWLFRIQIFSAKTKEYRRTKSKTML